MTTKPAFKRQTASEQVADYLGDKIMRGELLGGQQIRQEAVADELGVSRIPVREALLLLEAEGLVVNRPHRGAVVAELSIGDAHDVFESRLLIEPYLVARAGTKRTEQEVDIAQRAMEAYEAAIERNVDEAELNALNWELHLALMRPSAMTRMLGFVATLLSSADRYLRLQIRPPEARQRAVEDHRMMFEAFALQLPERCQELTHRHIFKAREDVILRLSKFRPAVDQPNDPLAAHIG